jgi:esterase/lipase superfamily enzyme
MSMPCLTPVLILTLFVYGCAAFQEHPALLSDPDRAQLQEVLQRQAQLQAQLQEVLQRQAQLQEVLQRQEMVQREKQDIEGALKELVVPSPHAVGPFNVASGPNYAVMRVFFATDRNLTRSTKPYEMFGASRSELRYGTCEVSIPREHRMGALESPSILKLEFREDPAKHVALLKAEVLPKGKFFSGLATSISSSARRDALLFIHGYNVTFADAARRTAQIAYDLGFHGAPVFYSWPSRGTTAAYAIDEQSIEWSQTNLKTFLEDFLAHSDTQNVYLIAHSMGNRSLTYAVTSLLAKQPSLKQQLKEIILAAPDIDAEVFKRDLAPALINAGLPITLYASSEDRALVLSKQVHGWPRAGESGPGLVITSGIETIDATGTDTSFLGHSYYAEARSIVSDIFYMIRNGHRANERFGLYIVDTPSGRYWAFKK